MDVIALKRTTLPLHDDGHTGTLFEGPVTAWVACTCGWQSPPGSPDTVATDWVSHLLGRDAFAMSPEARAAWSEIVAHEREQHFAKVRQRVDAGEPSWESASRAQAHITRCTCCGAQKWDADYCPTCLKMRCTRARHHRPAHQAA